MESLDVKVISCKGLKSFNFFQKLSVYCAVSLGVGDSDNKSQMQQLHKTPVDRQGDRNPEWNHEIRFDLHKIPSPQRDLLFLHFDLFSEGIFGGKLIGQVRVPLADLVRSFSGTVRFVSYQIRAVDGKPNGVLDFSYKVNVQGKIAYYPSIDASPAAYDWPVGRYPSPAPVMCYPPPPSLPLPQVLSYTPPIPLAFPSLPMDPYYCPPGGYGYAPYGYPMMEAPCSCDSDPWRRGSDWTTNGSRGL